MKNEDFKINETTEKELELLSHDIVDIERDLAFSKEKFTQRLKNGLAKEIKQAGGPKITKTPKWKLIWRTISRKIGDKLYYVLYLLNIYK